jgi:membrane-associated phospholipid phosphatase
MAHAGVLVYLVALVLAAAVDPGGSAPLANRLLAGTTDLIVALVAAAAAAVGKAFEVWHHHPGFPSGHMAFVSCLALSLVLRSRRWLVPMAVLCPVFAACLVAAHYHSSLEVLGGAYAGVAVAVLGRLLHGRPDHHHGVNRALTPDGEVKARLTPGRRSPSGPPRPPASSRTPR